MKVKLLVEIDMNRHTWANERVMVDDIGEIEHDVKEFLDERIRYSEPGRHAIEMMRIEVLPS